jgi:hypothetical protein
VKCCTAGGPTPLLAVNVTGYEPPVSAAGVPDSTSADELNETPEGRAPDSDTDGARTPVAFTAKLPLAPTENVTESAEVITGAVGLAVVFAVTLAPFA